MLIESCAAAMHTEYDKGKILWLDNQRMEAGYDPRPPECA
jgi:hypothetical protein